MAKVHLNAATQQQQQLNNAAAQTNQASLIRQLVAENAYNWAFQNIYNHQLLSAIQMARMYSSIAANNLFQLHDPCSSESLGQFSRTPSPVAVGGALNVSLPGGRDKRSFLPFGSVQLESGKIARQSVYSKPPKRSASVSVSPKAKPGPKRKAQKTTRTSPKNPGSELEQYSQDKPKYKRYDKPPYSYIALITLAIYSSEQRRLPLADILKRMTRMFAFFTDDQGEYQGWRDSVRHNLSQYSCFKKVDVEEPE